MPAKELARKTYDGSMNQAECLKNFVSENAAAIVECCNTPNGAISLLMFREGDGSTTFSAAEDKYAPL